MIKRPLNARFSDAVREGRKITTIRNKPWPVGRPIMLYNWSGAAYRSKHVDVVAVEVIEVREIRITRRDDGGMLYAYGQPAERPIHETEGFGSRAEMDDWFRPLLKPGQTVTKILMSFEFAKGIPS
jgi:hypothetical protein